MWVQYTQAIKQEKVYMQEQLNLPKQVLGT